MSMACVSPWVGWHQGRGHLLLASPHPTSLGGPLGVTEGHGWELGGVPWVLVTGGHGTRGCLGGE